MCALAPRFNLSWLILLLAFPWGARAAGYLVANPAAAGEGQVITISYREVTDFVTGGAESFSLAFGDGHTNMAWGWLGRQDAFDVSKRYPENNDSDSYIATVVESSAIGTWTNSITIIVTNVPPMIDPWPMVQLEQGQPLARILTFADPGQDQWTATVDFGDGTSPSFLNLGTNKSVLLEHNYPGIGDYVVRVTVRDDEGAEGQSVFNVAVIPHGSDSPKLTMFTLPGIWIEGRPGTRYEVQRKDDLPGGDWLAVTEITLSNRAQFWVDLSATNHSRRFYRVEVKQ